jgi:protein phosphatase
MPTIGLLCAVALLAAGVYLLYDGLTRPLFRVRRSPRRRREARRAAAPQDRPESATRPAPAARAKPTAPREAAREDGDDLDEDDDITVVGAAPLAVLEARATAPRSATAGGPPPASMPDRAVAPVDISRDEGDDEGQDDFADQATPVVSIVLDEGADADDAEAAGDGYRLEIACASDRGLKRRRNEDSLLDLRDRHIFVVADGMGGHVGGDVASRLAVEVIGGAFADDAPPSEPLEGVPRLGAELARAILAANRRIYDQARAQPEYFGMGTTVVAARFSPNGRRLHLGHVGDSRGYRLRGGELAQLTTDHTLGAEGISGPMAGHLARALGVAPWVRVDVISMLPAPGDVYLLCTDGLTKMVSDEAIRDALVEQPGLEQAVQRLVAAANASGGRDNTTIVLVRVAEPAPDRA